MQMKYKLIFLVAFVLLYSILYNSGITCVIKHFFGVECLGCGYTRALICAIKFDFRSAFSYHAMFWTFPILLTYFFFDGKVFKNKTVNNLIPILIFAGFILNWL